VATSSYRSITSVALAAAILGAGCFGSRGVDPTQDAIENGTIAYPFVDETQPLGRNGPTDPFVIKSAVGGKEYTIEIPGEARDFDVQVPLAEIGAGDQDIMAGGRPNGLASPVATDKEMVAALPRLDKARPTGTAMLDGAFGVGNAGGPKQAPSYTLGIAKVNELFKRRQYEYALVELNQMIAFYPNSPQLHKMKGTVLLKMRNLQLAELAWIKALQLTPQDKALQSALAKLQKRLTAAGMATQNGALDQQPYSVPTPVGTQPLQPESALGH
jgi:hypothetical protein